MTVEISQNKIGFWLFGLPFETGQFFSVKESGRRNFIESDSASNLSQIEIGMSLDGVSVYRSGVFDILGCVCAIGLAFWFILSVPLRRFN